MVFFARQTLEDTFSSTKYKAKSRRSGTMKKFTFISAATVAAITLSACGGGGSGSTGPDPREAEVGGVDLTTASGNPNVDIPVSEAMARFSQLNDNFDGIEDDFTDAQTIVPTGGSAQYSGQLGFDALFGVVPIVQGETIEADASVVGDLELDITFEENAAGDRPITGDITNVLYADRDGNISEATNNLDVSGGIVPVLNPNGSVALPSVISADVVGDITFDRNGTPTTVDLQLDVSGQFAGTDGQIPDAARGFVVGNFGNDLVGGTGDLTLTIPRGRFAITAD